MTYQLIDEVQMPQVSEFIKNKLARFDTSELLEFKLYAVSGKAPFRGMARYPRKKAKTSRTASYRVTCGVNLKWPWSWRCPIAVGTESISRSQWRYITEQVTFKNAVEAMVFLAGHEAFHFLRRSGQIPGRNTEPSANRYGLEWLKEWRIRNE